MRIREIRTNGLFRLFNHVIPLNMDDRITIIHGPNGYGKTAILRMVAGLLGSQYAALYQFPFDSLEVEFDNDGLLRASKHKRKEDDKDKQERSSRYGTLELEYPPNESFRIDSPDERELRRLTRGMIEDFVPELKRVDADTWLAMPSGDMLSLPEVYWRYSERLPGRNRPMKGVPPWVTSITKAIPIHLIQAHRLEMYETNGRLRDSRYRGQALRIPAVAKYAEELADRIQATMREYGELSQSLDRSFPQRLLGATAEFTLTQDELLAKLGDLEEKRKNLMQAGLLDKDADSQIPPLFGIQKEKIEVLSVYTQDAEEKLAVFDDLLKRIDAFRRFLAPRLLFKDIIINKKDGLAFATKKGEPLPASSLSTGEQHEIVLLYELLFRAKPNSLILIDEPEISLHVAWQKEFLNDLLRVAELSQLDVLVATHSPDIINDRWDLTVELKGPAV